MIKKIVVWSKCVKVDDKEFISVRTRMSDGNIIFVKLVGEDDRLSDLLKKPNVCLLTIDSDKGNMNLKYIVSNDTKIYSDLYIETSCITNVDYDTPKREVTNNTINLL